MSGDTAPLQTLYSGWSAYQASLVQAVAPLSPDQLTWKPAPQLRSAGAIALHIAEGRIGWFHQFMGEGDAELAELVAAGQPDETVATSAAGLVAWLERSWRLVDDCLARWTITDLDRIYPHIYQGKRYAVPRQWVVSRIFEHDIHHGGELALTLGLQGLPVPDLGDNFGQPEAPLADAE
jgi:uncharacterized damage-inducible protein DinB